MYAECLTESVLCRKHYREYLVSLINAHSLDPALLYDAHELNRACERYQVDTQRGDSEEDNAYHARLLKVRCICTLPGWMCPVCVQPKPLDRKQG